MKENMRLAFQGIWLHKLRSALTMLGIVIGIAAIIAIVSTIKGTNEQIKESLVGSGSNIVNIELSQDVEDVTAEEGAGASASAAIPLVEETDLENIRKLDDVEDAASYVYRSGISDIYYQDHTLEEAEVYGVSMNYISMCGYRLVSGRMFTEKDFDNYRKTVIIDSNAVSALFPDAIPVGKVLEIQGETFTVIGTVQEEEAAQMQIETIDDYYTYVEESYGKVFMPQTSWPIIYNFDEVQNVAVKAANTDAMSAVGQEAEKALNSRFSQTGQSYQAVDIMETVRSLQALSEGANRQLIWIASISLLVGGIGVMNIMLVSVTERTREIGLKKAIGARKKRILLQFLTEAAVLGSLGGVLGVLSGIVLAQVISRISGSPVAISIPAIIGSVAFSMVIGLVFGLIPSIKAANLNPIEALRRE